MECPICYEEKILNKICKNGHFVCNICIDKINKCPLCLSNLIFKFNIEKQLSRIFQRNLYIVKWNKKCDKILFYKFKIYKIVFTSDYYENISNLKIITKKNIHELDNYILNVYTKRDLIKKYKIKRDFRICEKYERSDKIYFLHNERISIVWTE